MKIISSGVSAATTASSAPVEEARLSVIPAPAMPGVSAEELGKIKDQLQREFRDEVTRQIAQIRQEWQARLETLTENTGKWAARWEERLSAMEKMPRFSEEQMLQRISESVKKQMESVPVAAPPAAPAPAPQDDWNADLTRKEKTLQDLKTELAKISAISVPVAPETEAKPPLPAAPMSVENRPAIPETPAPTDADGLKKHLAQESAYGTSSRTTSMFAKLWLYLNESAIEIPLKNSKYRP